MLVRTYLNDGWKFFSQWSESVFDSDRGEEVRLPHTNVQTPFNCFNESVYQFVSGYRRILHADNLQSRYILTFEGVAHYCEVFVNGTIVGKHSCGYTAFSVDVTAFLHEGDNVLVVKVDSRESLNQPPFGFVIDYLTYGGIYRDVYMDVYQGAYVADAFVRTETEGRLQIDVELHNFLQPCDVFADILQNGAEVARLQYRAENARFTLCQDLQLKRWDIDSPNVYDLKLTVDGNVYTTTFGVRTAKFTPHGFYLNGRRVKIVGLNRHQSFPYVGYAMPESMQRRDAQILKNKLCVNAVRTSHYPQSQYFLDECDRLGLLVFTEIPGWQHIGDEKWQEIALQNVKEMILQNRNHPSVVLWGVRINESLDCDTLYQKTNALAHHLDGTRQTGGVRYLAHSHLLEDVYTYNDFNRNGATNRKLICDKDAPYLVSEYNGHMFPTKSFDDFPHRRLHMLRYAKMLDGVFADDDTCGAFGWCMFDYNTHKDFGSGDRICYHGVTDMFRNAKMAAGIFSSQGKQPFLQLCFTTDIGDYPEGYVGDMYCLTNADYVEVYKGGIFIKKYTHSDSPFKHLPNAPILIDDLIGDRLTLEDNIAPKYAAMIKQVIADIKKYGLNFLPVKSKLKIARIMSGTKLPLEKLVQLYNKYDSNWGSEASDITVKAFKKGVEVARQKASFVQKVQLTAEVSSHLLHENTSYDVAAVNIVARDQNGNVVPYICRAVHLRTEGVIQLVGESVVPLQGGMSGTYVKTVGKKGKGKLFVDDLTVEFEVV